MVTVSEEINFVVTYFVIKRTVWWREDEDTVRSFGGGLFRDFGGEEDIVGMIPDSDALILIYSHPPANDSHTAYLCANNSIQTT